MFYFITLFFLLFCKVEGGQLLFVKTPPSIKLQEDGIIDQSLLPEVFAAALGFTTEEESEWNKMKVTDPFSFAEAIVILYVDGINSLEKGENLKKYKLNNNENKHVTWNKLRSRIIERYPMENNTLINWKFTATEDVDEFKTNFLNKYLEEDSAFLKEISSLNRYIKNVKRSNGVPDLYWFNLETLHQLSDLKGTYHRATNEAKDLVYSSLLALTKKFSFMYKDRVVVALISDASQTRKTRSVTDEKPETPNVTNEFQDNIYDPDFPVIFNIILWFTIALIFSLLAVSVFIASMDPGRDSIIYRMTSNRMKKDS